RLGAYWGMRGDAPGQAAGTWRVQPVAVATGKTDAAQARRARPTSRVCPQMRAKPLGSFALRGCSALGLRLSLRCRDGPAERLHQIDDLAFVLVGRLRERLALGLLLQQIEQRVSILVVVALRLPFCGEVLDQRLRHLDLGRLDAR